MNSYRFTDPNGAATDFDAQPDAARRIFHALCAYWSGERVEIQDFNTGETWFGEADTQLCHTSIDEVIQ